MTLSSLKSSAEVLLKALQETFSLVEMCGLQKLSGLFKTFPAFLGPIVPLHQFSHRLWSELFDCDAILLRFFEVEVEQITKKARLFGQNFLLSFESHSFQARLLYNHLKVSAVLGPVQRSHFRLAVLTS